MSYKITNYGNSPQKFMSKSGMVLLYPNESTERDMTEEEKQEAIKISNGNLSFLQADNKISKPKSTKLETDKKINFETKEQ